MRELQMVTYPSLTLIQYPPNSLMFYGVIIQVANIDFVGSFLEKYVYDEELFVETDAFSQKFENYDFGAKI
jgi:hypothetical protein